MGIILSIAALALAWGLVVHGPRMVAIVAVVALSTALQAHSAKLLGQLAERGRDRAQGDPWAVASRRDQQLLRAGLRTALARTQIRNLAPAHAR